MPRVGWAGPQSQPVARAIRRLNIDTRQCQFGRRIAPPVIATFELAHVFLLILKEKSGSDEIIEAALALCANLLSR